MVAKPHMKQYRTTRLKHYALLIFLVQLFVSQSLHAQYDTGFQVLGLNIKASDIDKILQTADSLKKENRMDSAALLFEAAFTKSDLTSYTKGIIKSLIGKSFVAKEKNDYDASNSYLEQALKLCTISSNTLNFKSYLYSEIGANHAYRGMFEKAALYFEKGVYAARNAAYEDLPVETIYTNLAGVYTNAGMYDKAQLYIDKIAEQIRKKPNKQLDVYRLWLSASLMDMQNKEAEALRYIDTLIPIARSINDIPTLFTAYWKAGDIAIVKRDLANARFYLNQLRTISAQVEPVLRIREYKLAAQAARLAKDYKLSIKEYEKVLALATEIGSIYDKYSTHSGMAKTYAAMKDYQRAYEQEQWVKIYKDSLSTEEQSRNIAAVEARFQHAQKDKDLAEKDKVLAQKNLELYQKNASIKNKNVLVGASLLALLTLSAVFYFLFKNYRQKQAFKEEAMRLQLKEKELGAMQSMMDAEEQERTRIARDIHDGLMIKFSTVTMNLSALFDGDKSKEPYLEQLDKAISSLRNVAHNLMPDVLLDGGLSEALYYFCENINEEINFEISFSQVNELPRFEEKFELSVYRMVQELIQNVVKHAKADEALVQLSYNDGILNITVEDNGVGMQPEKGKTAGLGLKSIQNRIASLGGSMDISSDEASGTSVILEFVTPDAMLQKTGRQ